MKRRTASKLVCATLFVLAGCVPSPQAEPQGEGPGGREQPLALSPEREREIGREAYREILDNADVLPKTSEETSRVREVGLRIAETTSIKPLMREIHLHDPAADFEWEFNVVQSERINAFCLPGGKVAVYTGLLDFVRDDDELATVLGHEIAHALAHHASERIAVSQGVSDDLRASGGRLDTLTPAQRRSVLDVISPGTTLDSLAYGRFQESEADHIGVFLMTFAGYDPEAALGFWERMRDASGRSLHLPEILSDHPADARRIAQLQEWVPLAQGGKAAFDRGDIVNPDE